MVENLDGLVEMGIIKSVIYNKGDNLVEKRIHRDAGGLQPCEFVIIKRYSELLSFHERLFDEMKPYLKKNRFPVSDFPAFPSKSLFKRVQPDFLSNRISQFNSYFMSLFMQYPTRVPYSLAVTELCTPTPLAARIINDPTASSPS
jgi:hypothetical protein